MGGARRILVSVRPRLLGDAIAEVLRYLAGDDVVVACAGDQPAGFDWSFDAAVVTSVPAALDAGVVIELAADGVADSKSTVSGDGWSRPVTVAHTSQLLDLLEEHCGPGSAAVARLAPTPSGDDDGDSG